MPDVKWYGSTTTLTLGTTATSGGTDLTVLIQSSNTIASSNTAVTSILGGASSTGLTLNPGTGNTTVSSGALSLPAGTAAAPSIQFTDADSGFKSGTQTLADPSAVVTVYNGTAGAWFGSGELRMPGTWWITWNTTTFDSARTAILYQASSGVLAIGTTTTNAAGSLNLTNLTSTGVVSLAGGASHYVKLASRAANITGGELTSKVDAACYYTNDKFVISYRLASGAHNFLSIPLDGTTTTWTNSTTAP